MLAADLPLKIKRFRAAAKAAGLKLTKQRLEIFKEIASRNDHPNAESVFSAVKRILPAVSLDTVYRSLWTFADIGLIGTLGPRLDSQRFDGNAERHHHFVCLRCGKVIDFTSRELDEIELPETAYAFGRVAHAQVEVGGVCAECEIGRTVASDREKQAERRIQEGTDG